MPRDSRRALVQDEGDLIHWLRSQGFQVGEHYAFYPLNRGERDKRVAFRIKDEKEIEIFFDSKWHSMLDSMNLKTPEDSPEIRARRHNTDPWSD